MAYSFPAWAGFSERSRDGNKFVVAERPTRQSRRSMCTESDDAVVEERRLRKENAAHSFLDETGDGDAGTNFMDTLFDKLNSNEVDLSVSDQNLIK